MGLIRSIAGVAAALLCWCCAPALPAHAQSAPALGCAPFTPDVLAAPEPREAALAKRRFEQIKAAVLSQPYRVLFFGDSLIERFETWDAPILWHEHMAARGVLNAGVSGDRTEHLLWRLDNGNLAGPPPRAAVLLIGTNDLGHGRPPDVAAEGIRANLLRLRERLPAARILLLGLWPREIDPNARLRREVAAVNAMIRGCGDGSTVVYADIGGVLLDPDGRLSPAISPDHLHFDQRGYQRLVPQLDALIDRVAGPR